MYIKIKGYIFKFFAEIVTLLIIFSISDNKEVKASDDSYYSTYNYTFEDCLQNEADFVSKENNSNIINYYNIYADGNKITDDSMLSTRSTYNRDTSGYIPNNNSSIIGRSIIGSDDRIKVETTTTFPFNAICYILITFPDGNTYKGSAWMYYSDIAITAGHCVYDSNHGGWAKSIKIFPGANGSNSPYGDTIINRMHTSTKWTENSNEKYDYAVLVLNSSLGNKTGYFGTHYTFWSLKGKNVTITGYPGEYYREQYSISGSIKKCNSHKLYYDMDTTGGQSGCPVYWYTSDHGYQAIGIHAYGSSSLNSATRITSSMFDFFESFRD